MPLKDKTALTEAEEAGAILISVSDLSKKGKPRGVSIARSKTIQDETNPLVLTLKREKLASYTQDGPSSVTQSNQLAIKEGSTRYSFGDDYMTFEFHYRRGSVLGKRRVSALKFNASTANRRVNVGFFSPLYVHVWRDSEKAFRIFLEINGNPISQTQGSTYGFLEAIYGERMIVARQHPDE